MDIHSLRVFAATLLAAVAATGLAGAATSFDFLFDIDSVDNDSQLFLNLAVGSYHAERRTLEPMIPRIQPVGTDLPVVLFLAQTSGRSIEHIVALRERGLTWSVIFTNVGVPPDVLFAGIDRDPGPPYGKAWGYWKKHPQKPRLVDSDIVGLVQIQVGHRLLGESPFELARMRGAGKPVWVVVADRNGRPHRNAAGPPGHAKGPPPGQARGKSGFK